MQNGRRVVPTAFAALIVALLLAPAPLRAEPPQIERVEIFDAGIYCAETIERVPQPDAPGGYQNVISSFKLVKRTTEIPTRLGTRFGLRYGVSGTPHGSIVTIRAVLRFPSPGLRDPQSGKTVPASDHAMSALIGLSSYWEYHLEEAWEAVPGVWAFEFWDKDRKLAEQKFTLVKPQQDEIQRPRGCAPVVGSLIAPQMVR